MRRGRLAIGDPAGSRTFDGRRYDDRLLGLPLAHPTLGLHRARRLLGGAARPATAGSRSRSAAAPAPAPARSWDVLGRWAAGDRFLERTSVGGQGDDLADVNVDTWQTDAALDSWQLRVTLLRGGRKSPRLDSIGAMSSKLPDVDGVATSKPGPGSGITLDVPRYSQMVHRGHYPRWGAGGQAWCSPTSTSMVLGYYDALPRRSSYAWVPDGHVDPWVDHAARMTYDHAYDGTGNWPFNTAYAATLHRPRVRDPAAQPARGRAVHRGRDPAGRVDLVRRRRARRRPDLGDQRPPAGDRRLHRRRRRGRQRPGGEPAQAVRRVYDRGQFEDVWLPTSGGLVYVIHDDAHPLPAGTHSNW